MDNDIAVLRRAHTIIPGSVCSLWPYICTIHRPNPLLGMWGEVVILGKITAAWQQSLLAQCLGKEDPHATDIT
ncbi:hypothetical protein C0J52_04235 [Blattella germanica]|nr:hypothetical protein C0J52_04235 [Blattella germanica]